MEAVTRPKAAFFDVDGTLAEGYYILKLPDELFKYRLFDGKALEDLDKLYNAYKGPGNSMTYEQFACGVVDAFGQGIRGKKSLDVSALSENYVDTHPDELFGFAPGLVNSLRRESFRTVAVSGSPIFAVKKVAKILGINDAFGTTYRTEGDLFTGGVAINCATGDSKRLILNHYDDHSFSMGESAAFGHSVSDAAMLEMTGHRFAVMPSPELAEMARQKSWTVCDDPDSVVETVELALAGSPVQARGA